jgi:hypothetical protein
MMLPTRERVSTHLTTALLGLSACLFAIACGGSNSNAVQPAGVPTLFGDGSFGNKTISANTVLADLNPQYGNFTVDAAVTLTVRSGTVIRCTGAFTNNGTIAVSTGTRGGQTIGSDSTSDSPAARSAGVGYSEQGAGNGEFGSSASIRSGGPGGGGLDESSRYIRIAAHNAGGAGGGTEFTAGGAGGGGFTVLAFGAINVASGAAINADGLGNGAGAGGGAGGVIILASRTSITVLGADVLTARGATGGVQSSSGGIGGAGGGGIVHCISPSNSIPPASVNVGGGGAMPNGPFGIVTASPRSGGGGGGACGGDGRNGGQVDTAGTPLGGPSGDNGDFFDNSGVDPTGLFP